MHSKMNDEIDRLDGTSKIMQLHVWYKFVVSEAIMFKCSTSTSKSSLEKFE